MEVRGGRTDSAVLVPLFTDAGGACTPSSYTRRRDDLKRHAGEISFDGGDAIKAKAWSTPPCARRMRRSACRRTTSTSARPRASSAPSPTN